MEDKQNNDVERNELERLRAILIGDYYKYLELIKNELQDPNQHAERVAKILSEAATIRSGADKSLTHALMPSVEEAIQTSVKRDPTAITDAIFPVIGPAIRKSVTEMFSRMLETLNRAYEQKFSIQSLKWRLEAKRTGKSFSEIVVLRTLDFQVEQVFLIHRKTGLLLQCAISESAIVKDPDLVSAMLTAITDFAQDSFEVGKSTGDSLRSVQIGELKIFIEQGPLAVVAAAIRGNYPSNLAVVLREALERIHLSHDRELEAFKGDAKPFDTTRYDLEDCLIAQSIQEKKTGSETGVNKRVWLGAGALAMIFLALWGVREFREVGLWNEVVAAWRAESGIMVTAAERSGDGYVIRGLRDRFTRQARAVISEETATAIPITYDWQSYLSAEPEIILRRVRHALRPPPGVTLRLDDDNVIHLIGQASRAWLSRISTLRVLPAGVEGIYTAKLEGYDDAVRVFDRHRTWIEAVRLPFGPGSSKLTPHAAERLKEVSNVIYGLQDAAKSLDRRIKVVVIGHSDPRESRGTTPGLSQERARVIAEGLQGRGIAPNSLAVVSRSHQYWSSTRRVDGENNQRVSFKVRVQDKDA